MHGYFILKMMLGSVLSKLDNHFHFVSASNLIKLPMTFQRLGCIPTLKILIIIRKAKMFEFNQLKKNELTEKISRLSYQGAEKFVFQ